MALTLSATNTDFCRSVDVDLDRRRLYLSHLNTTNSLNQAKQIHAHILRSSNHHHHHHHLIAIAGLIRIYSAHRRLDLANRTFDQFNISSLPPKTISASFFWNLIIRAHTSNSSPLGAILVYNRMLLRRVPPDKFTFPFAIKACAHLLNLSKGKEIHAFAIKVGFFNNDVVLRNVLIHFYLACGCSDDALMVFDTMPARTVVSWTALVSGLIACGQIGEARRAFESMPVRNVVTWTAMIDGYARNGQPQEAFRMFPRMLASNVRPNDFTLVALLIACTELGSLSLGRWVHEFARQNGGLHTGVYVGTALIDMYSKSGSLEDAVRVFEQMSVRSVATWNSMITSVGVHGFGRKAVELFKEMEMEGLKPDGITLVGVLCACAKEGMAEEGLRLFKYISDKYDIQKGLKHYRCLMELLDCKQIDTVEDLVRGLGVEEQRMLLMVCREDGGTKLEKIICGGIVELEGSQGNGSSLGSIREGQCFEWELG